MLLFDSIYEFLDKNCLLNSHQSELRLLYTPTAITHDIFTAFDANLSLVVQGARLIKGI